MELMSNNGDGFFFFLMMLNLELMFDGLKMGFFQLFKLFLTLLFFKLFFQISCCKFD